MIEVLNYKKELHDYLKRMHAFIEPLTDAELQWSNGKSWSILQIAEHILITEEMVIAMLEKGSERMSERLELFGNDKLKKLLVDYRERKVNAPPSLVPMGKIGTANEFLKAMNAGRMNLIEKLENNEILISTEVHVHPMLGEMTVSDWLYFINMHAERHFFQMQERLQMLTTN